MRYVLSYMVCTIYLISSCQQVVLGPKDENAVPPTADSKFAPTSEDKIPVQAVNAEISVTERVEVTFSEQQEHLLSNLDEHLKAVVNGAKLPDIPMPIIANPDVIDPADNSQLSPYFAPEPRTPGASSAGYFDGPAPVRPPLMRNITPVATPQVQKLPPSFALRMRERQASDMGSDDGIFTPKDGNSSPAAEQEVVESAVTFGPKEDSTEVPAVESQSAVEAPDHLADDNHPAVIALDFTQTKDLNTTTSSEIDPPEAMNVDEVRDGSSNVSELTAETKVNETAVPAPTSVGAHQEDVAGDIKDPGSFQSPTISKEAVAVPEDAVPAVFPRHSNRSYALNPVGVDAWPALLSTPVAGPTTDHDGDEGSENSVCEEENSADSSGSGSANGRNQRGLAQNSLPKADAPTADSSSPPASSLIDGDGHGGIESVDKPEEDELHDLDSDGGTDEEYDVTISKAGSRQSSALGSPEEEDAFKLMGSHSTVAPGEVTNDSPSESEESDEDVTPPTEKVSSVSPK
jgi:hypothetical protein